MYIPMQTNTYQYIQNIPYVQYKQILTNTNQYRPLHTIHIHTYKYKQYMSIHMDTYQNRPIPINMYNAYKYISILTNICTYQISVHANDTGNTYQYLQYIQKTIHTITYHNTYHANTCQYIPQYNTFEYIQ